MNFKKEQRILEDYLTRKNLRHSRQRSEILEVFLKTDRHLTADELYRLVQKKHPDIGYATIYRTLKILCQSGLCRELRFDDGTTKFEHRYEHQHHDHIICIKCNTCVEVMDLNIEHIQEKLFEKYKFYPVRHRMELYGICDKCGKAGNKE
jgi:Fur family ferric uptake transcriptional regulator